MAKGINKAILVGNIGQEPETRTFPDGGSVTNISLATSESWKDKQGQKQERTEWHRVTFNGKLAEIAAQYLRKGSKVYVEGSLRTRKWQDNQGVERYTTEVIAREMQMLDSKGDNAGQAPQQAPQQNQYQQAPQQPQQNQYQNAPQMNANQASQQAQMPPSFDDFDDDIPF